MPTTRTRVPGRLLAWFGLVVSLGLSIAGNVSSAWPALGPRIAAGAAPVCCAIAVGLIERVSLEHAARWQRILIWLALGAIGLFSFATSFQHQYDILRRWRTQWLGAVLTPLVVDGLIVMCSVCLAVIAASRRAVTTVPEVALNEAPVAVVDVAPEVAAEVASARPLRVPARRTTKSRSGRKTVAERREEISHLLAQDPDMTNTALARALGISRARVGAIRSNGVSPAI